MFISVNNKVTYLKRIKFGSITIDDSLELGHYRELSKSEIEKLLQL